MDAEYSQEHVLSAVQMLRRFSVAEPIFIAPDNDDTSILYGKLVSFRVTHFIKLKSSMDYAAEVRRMLLAKDDQTQFAARVETMQAGLAADVRQHTRPVIIPPGLVMCVAVAGTMSRIGVTTQTFALWYYIKSLGFNPAIRFADNKMLSILTELYGKENEESKGFVIIRGIPFCTGATTSDEFNAYITDMGVLTELSASNFTASDISVLVTGVKPWELQALGLARAHLIAHAPRRLVTLASFAGDQDLQPLSTFLGNNYAAAPYHPDIWSESSPAAYQAVILPLVKAYCAGLSADDY